MNESLVRPSYDPCTALARIRALAQIKNSGKFDRDPAERAIVKTFAEVKIFMMMTRLRPYFTAIALCAVLFFSTGCAIFAPPEPPSPFSQVQEETSGRKAPSAVAKDATQGSTFNQFFPRSVAGYGDYEVVPAQEKQGFAQFKVNKDGANVAVLSINDTSSNPSAAAKYDASSRSIQGFPALEIGNNGTGVLVAQRYQVKVQSRSDSFSAADREAWLQKFDFKGLSQLSS